MRDERGIAALRLFLLDLATVLEQHAESRLDEVDSSCWDWDVIPLFLKFVDEIYQDLSPAGAWGIAETDVAAAFGKTVVWLQTSPVLPR